MVAGPMAAQRPTMLPRLLQEPLLHFLGLGALLFGLYSIVQDGAPRADKEIVLSRDQVQSLQAQFQRVWQRPPTAAELQGLLDSWVREEVFYREGLAMGLDRDDPVVRRRVSQKFEFIGDAATPAPPSTADLQAWLDTHADKYQVETRYSLSQVFFDAARHGDKLDAEVAGARRALNAGSALDGDPTPLPPAIDEAPAAQLKHVFGQQFTEALVGLPVGSWQGPLHSSFGLHLVRLTAVQPGRPLGLDEAREQIERDFLQARASEANSARYAKLRASYTLRNEAAGAATP